jgi:hypothetical protein
VPEKRPSPVLFRGLALVFALLLALIILSRDLNLISDVFALLYAIPFADKFGHFILFGLLSLFVALGFPTGRVRLWLLPILKSSLVIIVLVTIEEITQIPLANRSFSVYDLTADFAGVYLFGEIGAYLRSLGKSDPPMER